MADATHPEEMSLKDWQRLVRLNARLFVALCVAGTLAAVGYHVLLPSYSAGAVLLVQDLENNPLHALSAKLGRVALSAGDARETAEKQHVFLTSFEFFLGATRDALSSTDLAVRKAVSALKPRSRLAKALADLRDGAVPPLTEEERIAKRLQRRVSVEIGKSNTISLTVAMADPADAITLANLLAEVASRRIAELEANELTRAGDYVRAQLDTSEARLAGIAASVIAFKKKHKILSIDASQNELASQIIGLKKSLAENRIRYEENGRVIGLLSREWQLKEAGDAAEVISQLRRRLESLRHTRSLLVAQGFEEGSARVREIDGETASTARKLDLVGGKGAAGGALAPADDKESLVTKVNQLRRENQFLGARIETIQHSLDSLSGSQVSLPQDEQTILDLKQKTDLEYALHRDMKTVLLQLEVQKISVGSQVRLVDKASAASIRRDIVLPAKIALGLLAGVLLGLGIVYLLETTNPVIKSRSDVRAYPARVVGHIPDLEANAGWKRRFGGRATRRRHLLMRPGGLDSPLSRSLKHLRAEILALKRREGDAATVACVLSAARAEGKSFLTANMGIIFAQMGLKTLLIDADARTSTLSDLLDVDRERGLVSLLRTGEPIERLIVKEVRAGLDVLPSGKSSEDVTELLSADALPAALADLRRRYELVLIDTPPVNFFPDAIAVARHSDLVTFVEAAGRTTRESLEEALERLTIVDRAPLCFILNRAERKRESEYDYYLPFGGTRRRDADAVIA